jgi:hypothetical protein
MFAQTGFNNLDELMAAAVPEQIRPGKSLNLPGAGSKENCLPRKAPVVHVF